MAAAPPAESSTPAAVRFRVPHTLILLFGMIALAWLATYVLPQGNFARAAADGHGGREQVVPGTYAPAEETVQLSPLRILTAIPEGFAAAQDIIFFVFLVGGAFGVLRATGAIDALIAVLLRTFGRSPALLVIGTMTIFALGSSTIGMAEEYLPFVPVLLALAIGLGFDAVTAVGILCIGYGIGYGVATINPFTVMIAQEVAGLQPTSGFGYRLAITVPFLAIGIHHVWSYARKVKADPSASLVADQPRPALAGTAAADARLETRHVVVLAATAIAVAVIVHGLGSWSGWGWYVAEMGAMFLGLSVVLAAIARLAPDDAAQAFCRGAAELTTTALLIGFARSILVVLDAGNVVDTIVHGVAQPLQAAGPMVAAVGMLVVQSLCNLFIPSGSGQAFVTMPIMAPLADLVGVQRQVAVLAFQFGDGFTNILVPTNAVLIGILTMAGVPYDRWLRFVLPFMLKIWLASAVVLAVAVWIGYT
ncbi:MAG: AbgT family transporter [Acidobacteriota bacterium]